MIIKDAEYRALADAVLQGESSGGDPGLVVGDQLCYCLLTEALADVVDPVGGATGTFDRYGTYTA